MVTSLSNSTTDTNLPTTETAHLGRSMAKATAWMVLLRLAMRVIGLGSTMILARLLVPADFGLVAMGLTVAAASEALSEFNFDLTLIRDRDAQRDEYDTAWTLSIIRGLLIGAFLAAIAGLTATFLGDHRVEAIVYALAVLSVIEGFHNIGIVEFRKTLRFGRDFAVMFWPKVAATLVTVSCAFLWRSYWALVLGMGSERVVRLVLGYALHPYRPRLALSKWRSIIGFSSWMLFHNVAHFMYLRIDSFIIAKFAGAQPLGLYTVAFETSNLATSELIQPIRRAIFPAYAKLVKEPRLLRAAFVDVWALTLVATVPIAAGIGLIADPLVHVLLGPQWLETIPLIRILSVYGLTSIAGSNIAPLFLALGRPAVLVWFFGMGSIILVPLLIWGVMSGGAYGAAIAVTVTNASLLIYRVMLAMRPLELSWNDLLRCCWRSVIATLAMAAAVVGLQAGFFVAHLPMVSTLLEVFALSLVGAVTYTAVLLWLWWLVGQPQGAESQILVAVRDGWTSLAK